VPDQPLPQAIPDDAREHLPDHSHAEDDADGDQRHADVAVDLAEDAGYEGESGKPTAEKTDERQQPGDEALAVARHGERHRRRDEQQVEQVHRVTSGRSTTRAESQGLSHPTNQSSRSINAPVKPHTSRPRTVKPGPM
jgi:hypothetical protein